MSWFRRARRETVALVHVGARTISAACVHYHGTEVPLVVYSTRATIVTGSEDAAGGALEHTLGEVCDSLREQGIPALTRVVGLRRIDRMIISLDPPWQQTVVHHEVIEREHEFIVDKKLVQSVLGQVSKPKDGSRHIDARLLGTTLNGYPVQKPYGKRVARADFVLLTTTVAEDLFANLRTIVRHSLRLREPLMISGASLRQQALRVAFPHEKDFLIVDAVEPTVDASLVQDGVLSAVETSPKVRAEATLEVAEITDSLTSISMQHPLPRTVFLLAAFDQIESVQKTFLEAPFATLWLSDTPPRVVAVITSHLNGLVRYASTDTPDLHVMLMALYWRYLAGR